MLITKLERTKHTNRVMIFIDNEYSFTIGDNTLIKYKLYKGSVLSEEQIEEIKAYDLAEICYLKALNKIGTRPRSEKEAKEFVLSILNKPKYKELVYNKTLVLDKVLTKLKVNGLLNDEDFARWLIESRIRQGKKSKLELTIELRKFDISKNIYEGVLAELFDDSTQEDLALKLAEKKLISLPKTKYTSKDREIKTMQYLARKGFNFDLINKVVKKIN